MAKKEKKYAKALFDTAVEKNELETMYESFSTILLKMIHTLSLVHYDQQRYQIMLWHIFLLS